MKTKQLLKNAIIACIILSVPAIYSANFNSNSTYLLIIGGFLISFIDFIISIALGMNKLNYSRLLISLNASLLIIYILQLITEGYLISFKFSVLCAIVYAIFSNTFLSAKKEQTT